MVVQDVLKQMAEDIKQFTRSETIFGDPIEIQGNTIIPICKVSIGYGGGGGEGETPPQQRTGGKGTGAGGGAGLKIEPAALLVAKEGKISLLQIGGRESRVGSFLEKLPEVFDRMRHAKEGNGKADEAAST